MTDVLSPRQRSFNMSRIRNRDTRPEKQVRTIVHRLGYRYRLHQKNLPGRPDIVLTRYHKIIDVRGCFFHMHKCKYGIVVPATNAEFWHSKRLSNVERDSRNSKVLKKTGWRVLIVWECQTRDKTKLEGLLRKFLEQD